MRKTEIIRAFTTSIGLQSRNEESFVGEAVRIAAKAAQAREAIGNGVAPIASWYGWVVLIEVSLSLGDSF